MSDLVNEFAAPAETATPTPAPTTPAEAAAPNPGVAATPAEPTPAPEPPALKLPGKDAKPEDWAAYYKAIGAPENADGYQITVPEGQDPAFSKEAASVFAKYGLMPHQVEGITAWWNEKAASLGGEAAKAAEEQAAADLAKSNAEAKVGQEKLKNEWQGNYDANVELAKRAVRTFFPDQNRVEVLSAMEAVIGYEGMFRVMHAIGKGLGEGTLRGMTDAGAKQPQRLADQMFGEALEKAFPSKT